MSLPRLLALVSLFVSVTAAAQPGVEAEDYERILLPVTVQFNPRGWRTEVRMLIDSETPVETFPVNQPVIGLPFPQPPLRKPFDPTYYGLLWSVYSDSPPGDFVFVRKADADKIHINIRGRNNSRTGATWGVEVPVVRERELRTGRMVLLPLPIDPAFRHTLRIYDADALDDAQVRIVIFANDETTPRATFVREFVVEVRDFITPARLPFKPGYIEIDPIALAATDLAGATTARVDIEPLTPGLRFWAFVSVTNNDTSEVTTITPQ